MELPSDFAKFQAYADKSFKKSAEEENFILAQKMAEFSDLLSDETKNVNCDINKFKSFINSEHQGGLSDVSRFMVTINFPEKLKNMVSIQKHNNEHYEFDPKFLQEKISYFCESTFIPGKMLETSQVVNSGPILNVPHMVRYNNIPLVFLSDEAMIIRNTFQSWIDFIARPSMKFSGHYIFQFKDDYVTDITISQLNRKDQTTARFNLIRAFPISITDMGLSSSSREFHRIEVTFAYECYEPIGTFAIQ